MTSHNMTDREILPHSRVDAEGLQDWRILLGNRHGLHTRLATKNFAAGLDLLNRIGAAAEEADHHPDLDLRYTHLNVRLVSHDVGGLTVRDVRMAQRISELAAAAGVSARPTRVQTMDLMLNTPEAETVKPFWQATLGLSASGIPDVDLADNKGSVPGLQFRHFDDDPARMRLHLDINVPEDVAEDRVQAALDAGGTLVTDSAPAFWVLEDTHGNRICVRTWQGH